MRDFYVYGFKSRDEFNKKSLRLYDEADFNKDSVKFFSEVAPCGVLGSYILDKNEEENKEFTFKHHYITSAMDSEILCKILIAILEKRKILFYHYRRKGGSFENLYKS